MYVKREKGHVLCAAYCNRVQCNRRYFVCIVYLVMELSSYRLLRAPWYKKVHFLLHIYIYIYIHVHTYKIVDWISNRTSEVESICLFTRHQIVTFNQSVLLMLQHSTVHVLYRNYRKCSEAHCGQHNQKVATQRDVQCFFQLLNESVDEKEYLSILEWLKV
jgi:hypothetical protein